MQSSGDDSRDALIRLVRESVIGEDHVMETPYGARRVTYADYTASGRALTFVEDFIRDQVLPSYANTHTESSGTGLQTTRLREEAREIIREAVGGDDDTVVLPLDHPFVKEGRFASLLVRDRELADSLAEGFHELWRKAMKSLREIQVDPRGHTS